MWSKEEMLLGEDVKIRAGESGFTMLVAHPPYMRISKEGHTRVRHDMSTHRDMCGFANVGTLHVSVFP